MKLLFGFLFLVSPLSHAEPTKWGGEGIAMELNDHPFRAVFTFPCARGLAVQTQYDQGGSFVWFGTYVQLTGAPPPRPPVPQPAHYIGFQRQDKMSLTVVLDRDPSHPQTFVLTKGAPGNVVFCN